MASSKLHVAMFPWFAFGHMIPFLHLSNKLAERGHRVSYLLPKGAQSRLEQLNHHPNLIRFFPLDLPHIDGLPPGTETASDVPLSLHGLLATAFDKTRDQVESLLTSTLKPKADVVFFDFGCWIPAITRQLGAKSIAYSVVNACTISLFMVPARLEMMMSLEEIMQPPPGYPSSNVLIKLNEVPHIALMDTTDPLGRSTVERTIASAKESDAIALRTCHEIEGLFCEYLAQQYAKSVLLTGPVLQAKAPAAMLEEKWENWLNKFVPGSVVYCALGSQITLQKEQFQELVLGFELSGLPFLVALRPPHGCSSIEEALPEGFKERVGERGWVYGGWVPQNQILEHPSVGCFVSHCGFGSFWESLLSDCQIVLVPFLPDQVLGTRLMVEELKVAVEVERGADGNFARETLSKAIKSVMDKDSEIGYAVKGNHMKWRKTISSKQWQEGYVDTFIQRLQEIILESPR